MTTPDQNLEAAIIAAGANVAPRVTPADIEANIANERYFTAFEGANVAFWAAAPRVPDEMGDAEAEVLLAEYAKGEPDRSGPLSRLTFCVLTLRNGFTVTGESACASPENFNAEIGQRIARENAVAKVWPLMGYALRNKLSA